MPYCLSCSDCSGYERVRTGRINYFGCNNCDNHNRCYTSQIYNFITENTEINNVKIIHKDDIIPSIFEKYQEYLATISPTAPLPTVLIICCPCALVANARFIKTLKEDEQYEGTFSNINFLYYPLTEGWDQCDYTKAFQGESPLGIAQVPLNTIDVLRKFFNKEF